MHNLRGWSGDQTWGAAFYGINPGDLSMQSFFKLAIAPVLAIGFLLSADSQDAKAQFGVSLSFGNPGYPHGLRSSYGPSLGYPRSHHSPFTASSYYPGRVYRSSSYGYPSVRSSYYRPQLAPPVIVSPFGYRRAYSSPRSYGYSRRCY